MTRVVVDLG